MSGVSSSTSPYTNAYTSWLTTQNSMLLGYRTPDTSMLSPQPYGTSNASYNQFTTDQAFAGYLQQANSAAQSLLTQYQTGAFSAAKATSTDPGIVATAQGGATLTSYQVSVSALAQGQQIQSNNVATLGTNVSAGTYTFAITAGSNTQGSTTTNVSVAVNAGDTNQTVLDNLAQAINQSHSGSSASVVTDNNGNVRLQLTNNLTGQGASVSVADVTGNLTSQIGLTASGTASATTGGTSQVAQNSAYNVNGTSYSSYGNSAYLDNGNLQLTFAKTTSGVATVSVANDTSSFDTAMSSFVTAYNNAVGYANSTGTNSAGMLSVLQQTASEYSSVFSQAGVSFNKDGSMAFASSTFDTAAATNRNQIGDLTNALSGFTSQALSNLNLQSSSLVSQSLYAQQQLSNSVDSQYLNPYLSSLLQPLSSTSAYF